MRRRNQNKGTYAFIDSQNLNISVQRLGWKLDWKKFRAFLKDKYNVDKAFMFIGYVPEYESLYEQMHEAGYLVVLKPTYDLTRPRVEAKEPKTDKEGKKIEEETRPTKGNIDADLVLWAMKEIPNYSKAVLVSGDGDFYALVEYLEAEGKFLKLLAPSGFYSSLYNRFDSYIDRIDSHRHDLAYHDRRNRKQSINKKS